MANWALAKDYNSQEIAFSGPMYNNMQKNGNGKIIRNFGFSRQDLTSFGKPLTNFEIAGEDKAFYPATAMIMNDKNGSVVVRNNTVISPFNLRYAFKNWA